ncbi:MAG TPA: TssN family type VI secretion system protein [Flavisolibacter sp.]|nr:TssN family type VI secretion system protein [Flavisolibacter sp.]
MPIEFLLQSDSEDMKTQVPQKWKTAWLFLLLACVVSGALASLTLLNGGFVFRLAQAVGFLGLGLFLLRLFSGVLSFFSDRQKWLFIALSVLLIALVLGGIYLRFPHYSWLEGAAAVSAFLLPLVLRQVWHVFESFFFYSGKTWSYSNTLPLQQSTTFLNSMPVKFKVQLDDEQEYVFQAAFRAPVKMKLGLIFYHIIQQQPEATGKANIFVNEFGRPYKWVFQSSQFGFERQLDPDLSLIENGIRQNRTIVARRLKLA